MRTPRQACVSATLDLTEEICSLFVRVSNCENMELQLSWPQRSFQRHCVHANKLTGLCMCLASDVVAGEDGPGVSLCWP
jgi:hypothetical protein